MIVVARGGLVPAPVEAVWAVVRQVEELPAWLVGLGHAEARGPEGYGRRLRLDGSRAGDGRERQAEVIAWRAPTLLAWRYVAERAVPRSAGPDFADPGLDPAWLPVRADELHIQLTPAGTATRLDLYAVCPAGLFDGLLIRWGPARRWKAELARSAAALAAMFPAPARPDAGHGGPTAPARVG
ncbi:MAG TPA: SRPBCC family protein [Pilimelia sp.]|nr:SRPBCC family protein [Pilimelia sp.]